MKSKINKRGSEATKQLEHGWAMLREIEPDIPTAVFVILSAKTRKGSLGHFTQSTWRNQHGPRAHEIAVSPDLFCNPTDLLAVLLHEAAHSILRNEDGGCSPDNRGYLYYHRADFRNTCLKLGLDCEFHNTRYGWMITHWPRETGVPLKYGGIIRYFNENLPLGTDNVKRRLSDIRGKKTPESGLTKITCNCKDKRSIYVNKTALKKGGIVCRFCGGAFRV